MCKNEDELFTKEYKDCKKRNRIALYIGIVALVSVIFISLIKGNFPTSLKDIIYALLFDEYNPQVRRIVLASRVPRLVASLIVGAALSVSGMVYQEIFANRLASPDLLGVSAGAGCGASLAIISGLEFGFICAFSFFGGIIATLLTIIISQLFEKKDNGSISLILSGIVVGGLMNSLIGLCKYMSNDYQLSTITFWLLGKFCDVQMNQLFVAIIVIILGIIFLFLMRYRIQILGNGDMDASLHGIKTKEVKMSIIIATTIITAMSVCISGTIGWIGLTIPNLVRTLNGNDSRTLMSLTIVYGMFFTSLCDLFARTLTSSEIPVGVISGFLGTLCFVIILLFSKRGNI